MTKTLRTSAIFVAALAVSLSACGKGKDKSSKAPPKAAKPADKQPPPAPPKMTDEQFATRVVECWAAFDAGDMAKFQTCYTDKSRHAMADMVPPMTATGAKAIAASVAPFRAAFPDLAHDLQLVLVNGNRAAIVFLARGTNTGSLFGAPPTGKKMGYLGVQILVRDDAGAIVEDTITIDQSTMMGQLGMSPAPHPDVIEKLADKPTIVFGSNSEVEQANVAAVKASFEAFNAHDTAKLGELYADDALFKYVPDKQEMKGKAAFVKGLGDYYKMSSDVKTELSAVWAAGDYVVAEGVSAGTHDGDVSQLKATNKPFKTSEVHVYRFADGKIAEHSVYANSLAFAVQVGLVDPAKMGPPKKVEQ